MNTFSLKTRTSSIALLAFALVGATHSFAAHHELKIDKEEGTNIVLEGYDPVSYFTEKKAIKGSDKITTEWMGAVWQFSSESNRDRFTKDPERYVPAYGGRCAVSVFVGKASIANPACFIIEGDRLFLLSTPDLTHTLKSDFENIVSKADSLWPSLKDDIKFKGDS